MSDELILDIHTLFGPTPPRGKGHGIEQLQEHLAARGVSGAVTLSTRAIYYDAIAGNQETHEACARSEGYFLPADVLDPRIPNPISCVSSDSRILCVFPATQHWPLHFAPFFDSLRALVQTGRARTLWWEASRPGDITLIAGILDRVRYPAPIILGSVIGPNLREALTLAKQDTRLMIATDALSGVGEIATAIESIGPRRVLFGSGSPISSISGALRLLQVVDLPDSARRMVLGENVRDLLRRPNAAAPDSGEHSKMAEVVS